MATDKDLKAWEIPVPAESRRAFFHLHLGDDFFASAGHSDLQGGNVTADVELLPAGGEWRITLHCHGRVATQCDRCLGAMEVCVDDSYSAPLHPSAGGEVPPGDDSDSLYYDPTTGIADLLRPLADTLALSLGMSHMHREGECDPAIEAALDHRDLEGNRPLADALAHLHVASGASDDSENSEGPEGSGSSDEK